MITTHNQQAPGGSIPECETSQPATDQTPADNSIRKYILPPALQMQHPIPVHDPRAGVNPMVDCASYLFTIMGQLKTTNNFQHLGKLHKELMHEIHTFENAVKTHQYNAEYVQVCIYVICAAFDELISSTDWGKGKWETFSLLTEFNLDKNHQERFFGILEHAIQEPEHYIDLMELMYICLSMGYCGQYQDGEQDQAHLEQITNSLYKYIRAYRGNVSKLLSPAPLRPPKVAVNIAPKPDTSHWTVVLFTACVIMLLFIGLGYLMEMISNEAISKFTDVQKTVARNNLQQ